MNNTDHKIVYHFLLKAVGFCTFVVNSYFKNPEQTKHAYQFIESYKSDSDKQIIVAKINNSIGKVFKISAIDLVTKNKKLLAGFSTDDMINIIGLATIEKAPTVVTCQAKSYKYFALFAMLFVSALLISNITASKFVDIFGFTVTGGLPSYGCAYVLSYIITEVYGYKRARQVIWGSIICNLFLVMYLYITISWQPSSYWHYQREYALVLGVIPKIIFASLISYWCGEFINSYVIARMKIAYNGHNLLLRIVSSSFLAITVDTFLFIVIAYGGTMPSTFICSLIVRVYIYKLLFEFIMIPFIIYLIKIVKHSEAIDIYDINTQFTPFSLDVTYSDADNRMLKLTRDDEA